MVSLSYPTKHQGVILLYLVYIVVYVLLFTRNLMHVSGTNSKQGNRNSCREGHNRRNRVSSTSSACTATASEDEAIV
eukprot:m.347914 g.347914  ORF g.347914 m.347914 type:complete len:77 (+) comp34873_c0_seq1:212-442(+)